MSKKEFSSLLMLCGALQDISEICKVKNVSEKIVEVQLMIEKIVVKKKVI